MLWIVSKPPATGTVIAWLQLDQQTNIRLRFRLKLSQTSNLIWENSNFRSFRFFELDSWKLKTSNLNDFRFFHRSAQNCFQPRLDSTEFTLYRVIYQILKCFTSFFAFYSTLGNLLLTGVKINLMTNTRTKHTTESLRGWEVCDVNDDFKGWNWAVMRKNREFSEVKNLFHFYLEDILLLFRWHKYFSMSFLVCVSHNGVLRTETKMIHLKKGQNKVKKEVSFENYDSQSALLCYVVVTA